MGYVNNSTPSTSGTFALVWADTENAPVVTYPTTPKLKYTIIGDLVILEVPEMGLTVGAADEMNIVLPSFLVPAVHPDGLWKDQIIGLDDSGSVEKFGVASVHPDDGLLYLEPTGGTWTEGSATLWGFTIQYHLTAF